MASESLCFSKATVSTRSWMPDATRCDATIAVEPPTEPAVCTRNIGLPTAPERRRQVELGHHDALEHVGRLADDHGVDVGEPEPGVLERRQRRLAHQPGDRDVLPLGLGHRLADPDDRAALRHQHTLQDADEVLLQARARGGVGHGAVGLAGPDGPGRLADADEAGRHHRVGRQRAARGVERDAVAQARARRPGSSPGGRRARAARPRRPSWRPPRPSPPPASSRARR